MNPSDAQIARESAAQGGTMALALARVVDAVCCRFEAAWKAAAAGGARPRLEAYLADADQPAVRAALLAELLPIDAHHRRQAGDTPRASDYQALFPDLDPAWLSAALTSGPIAPGSVELSNGLADGATYISVAGEGGQAIVGARFVPGYELLGELGRGGMGVVYKARQLKLNRIVALKMIRGGHADVHARERFRREAEAVAQLQHPNIVQIHEVGEHNGRPYLALEFVAGGSLDQRLAGTPQPARVAAELVEKLAQAIHHAHERGVVHRDLKPANVLLAPNPKSESRSLKQTRITKEGNQENKSAADVRVSKTDISKLESTADLDIRISDFEPKLTDFGLAKLLDDASGPTRTGDMFGTPAYMAPEQAESNRQITGPATDVYGLGAILYELLTGRPPFRAETAIETLLQVRGQEPVPPSQLRPNCPRDLETICLKCLEKEPSKRYASARALAEDLEQFLGGHPISARPIGRWGRLAKWARRRPTTAALVLVSSLAAMLLLAVLVVSDLNIRQKSKETEDALLEAIRAKTRLSAALDRERQTAFFHRVRLAQAALFENNVRQAERYLEACVPDPDQPDLRGWEWHYLKRCCHLEVLTFREHGVSSDVAYSSDGKHVASRGGNDTLKVWDAATGEVRFTRPCPTQGPRQRLLAFSPDSKTLAVADPTRNTVTLLAVADGQVLHTLPGCLPTFSADGKRLATRDYPPNWVHIYDPATGKELRSWPLDKSAMTDLAFSPEGLVAATPRKDGTIRVWNMETGKERFVFQGQKLRSFLVLFAGDARVLAAGGGDGTIKLWDTVNGQELFDIKAHGPVECMAFSDDSRRLASADLGGTVKVWDLKGKEIQTFPGHGARVLALAFGPGGRLLASAGIDQTVKIWDMDKDPRALVFRGHKGYVLAAAFSPDSERILSAGFDGTIKIWNPATGEVARDFHAGLGFLHFARFSRDGTKLMAANADAAVKLWDTSGKLLNRDPGHKRGGSTVLAVCPDGSCVAYANADRTVSLKRFADKRLLTLSGHTDRVNQVAFSPDGRQLATCSSDHSVKLWDTTGRELRTFAGHTDVVRCVAFSADGRRLASGGADAMIRIWDADTGTELRQFRCAWGHTLHHLAFSPDRRSVAEGGVDAVVTLWDTESGQEVLDLPCHQMIVTKLAFSPNGRFLAAVIDDGTVRVWDATSAAQIVPR